MRMLARAPLSARRARAESGSIQATTAAHSAIVHQPGSNGPPDTHVPAASSIG
jgi:hypothetical protein